MNQATGARDNFEDHDRRRPCRVCVTYELNNKGALNCWALMLPRKGGRSYRFRGKKTVFVTIKCLKWASHTYSTLLRGCLFIILHVLGIQVQLETPRRPYLVGLGASFPRELPDTSQCTQLNLEFHLLTSPEFFLR